MSINITAVKNYIENHLSEIRNVKDLAKNVGANYETLRKDFRRRNPISLSSYLTNERIDKMKVMLLDKHIRCFEICYKVGFEREDTGAKVFKKNTGMTMEQFRRRSAQ